MENGAITSVGRMDVNGNQTNEMRTGERTKRAEAEYGRKEVSPRRDYDAVSKNGDTLELSENGKKMAVHPAAEDASHRGKKVISDTGGRIPENTLAGYPEAKLKQLYANREITRQQYQRIMKRKKAK